VNDRVDHFLESWEWRTIRARALEKHGARCQACGRTARDGVIINVDHVQPRARFPELALTLDNLQILCEPCNHGKGNRTFDWRPSARARPDTPEERERARQRDLARDWIDRC
jgi:5-methylcytosine-specific restriction endonuclease McrA